MYPSNFSARFSLTGPPHYVNGICLVAHDVPMVECKTQTYTHTSTRMGVKRKINIPVTIGRKKEGYVRIYGNKGGGRSLGIRYNNKTTKSERERKY